MFQLLYKSATLYLRNLRQISRLTDELELQLRKSMENEHLFRLLELQKALTASYAYELELTAYHQGIRRG